MPISRKMRYLHKKISKTRKRAQNGGIIEEVDVKSVTGGRTSNIGDLDREEMNMLLKHLQSIKSTGNSFNTVGEAIYNKRWPRKKRVDLYQRLRSLREEDDYAKRGGAVGTLANWFAPAANWMFGGVVDRGSSSMEI